MTGLLFFLFIIIIAASICTPQKVIEGRGMRWGNVAFHPRRGRPPYYAP